MRLSASIGLAAAIACCSAAPTSTEQSWIGEFYSLTVAYRRSQGCASDIVVFGGVVAAAQTLSEDMVAQGFFSHIEPNGAGPGERLAAAGVTEMSGWAENIYQGYQTAQGGVSRAQEALDAWIASPGHHANLVNCAYTHHGEYCSRGVICVHGSPSLRSLAREVSLSINPLSIKLLHVIFPMLTHLTYKRRRWREDRPQRRTLLDA